jgi:hypothetical protein
VDLCYGKQGRRQHGFLARTVTVMGWTRGLSLFIGERGGNMGDGAACTWAHNGLHHAHMHAAEVQGRPASVKSMWCCAACHMRLSRREPGRRGRVGHTAVERTQGGTAHGHLHGDEGEKEAPRRAHGGQQLTTCSLGLWACYLAQALQRWRQQVGAARPRRGVLQMAARVA